MAADPDHEQMLDENPLYCFSLYTQLQSNTVISFGQEILEILDAAIVPHPEGRGTICQGTSVNKAYGLFWLWVLGAYEVVRTMHPGGSARECFTPTAVAQLKALKESLAVLRIPFAKQELKGEKRPARRELSLVGVGHSPADLHYMIKGQIVKARELIEQFKAVISGITRAQVIADHRMRY